MNQLGNLIVQALSGQRTDNEERNPPSLVIKIPGSDNLESGIWSRKGRDGIVRHSFSLSRRYGKNLGKLSRTFNVEPRDGVQVLHAYWYLFSKFAEEESLATDIRQGFADLALRLATAFEFDAVSRATQADHETQVVNGTTLSGQAAATGNTPVTFLGTAA